MFSSYFSSLLTDASSPIFSGCQIHPRSAGKNIQRKSTFRELLVPFMASSNADGCKTKKCSVVCCSDFEANHVKPSRTVSGEGAAPPTTTSPTGRTAVNHLPFSGGNSCAISVELLHPTAPSVTNRSKLHIANWSSVYFLFCSFVCLRLSFACRFASVLCMPGSGVYAS